MNHLMTTASGNLIRLQGCELWNRQTSEWRVVYREHDGAQDRYCWVTASNVYEAMDAACAAL